jgi:hypothetical protein
MGYRESLDRNTETNEKLYREQYYKNHGEYPPSLLGGLFGLLWFLIKGVFKLCILPFKGIFYIFPRFLWRKGKVGKILFAVYIGLWLFIFIGAYINS